MKKPVDCKWKESCDCVSIKSKYCERCDFYWQLDSGYGYCKSLPEHTIVAWCRDVCSLFKVRSK